MNPVRIQRSRQKKQISPNGLPIKYCGRPSSWSNKFRVVQLPNKKWSVKTDDNPKLVQILINNCKPVYELKIDAQRDAVKCFSKYKFPYLYLEKPDLEDFYLTQLNVNLVKKELSGYNLSCWCKLNEPCHVDIYLKILKL